MSSSYPPPLPPPDLTSILRTLAQHSGHPAPPTTTITTPQQKQSQPRPQQSRQRSHLSSPSSSLPHHPTPLSGLPLPNLPSGPPPIDPSLITTYPPALRYTTSLLASNPSLTARIKKLIASQHSHERMWWAGRSGVLAERAKRVEGRKAVNDVLRALGGVVAEEEDDARTEEEAFGEFDGKVYKACLEMERDVRRQLKEMGIPGFVVRGELIKEVGRERVKELEGKMMALLEDLCRD